MNGWRNVLQSAHFLALTTEIITRFAAAWRDEIQSSLLLRLDNKSVHVNPILNTYYIPKHMWVNFHPSHKSHRCQFVFSLLRIRLYLFASTSGKYTFSRAFRSVRPIIMSVWSGPNVRARVCRLFTCWCPKREKKVLLGVIGYPFRSESSDLVLPRFG